MGLNALALHRFAEWLRIFGAGRAASVLEGAEPLLFRSTIAKDATIHSGTRLTGRGVGVFIDGSAVIGHGCRIGDDVTIGPGSEVGHGVTIHAGAKIEGGVRIGDRAVIGRNAVVRLDVQANARVAAQPAPSEANAAAMRKTRVPPAQVLQMEPPRPRAAPAATREQHRISRSTDAQRTRAEV